MENKIQLIEYQTGKLLESISMDFSNSLDETKDQVLIYG